MRECAYEGSVSYDPVSANIRVCEDEMCNASCENCECSGSAVFAWQSKSTLCLVLVLLFIISDLRGTTHGTEHCCSN